MIKKELENIIKVALKNLSVKTDGVLVEIPLDFTNGDYATNVSLVYAKQVAKNPKEFAEDIKSEIEKLESGFIDKIEIAGPGFINFFVSQEAIEKDLKNIKKGRKGFDFNKGEKINIEFISANPTGALHIGHGRGAFYGDILSNLFVFTGAEVSREYYINDSRESVQIKELGKTALGVGEQYKTKETGEIILTMDVSGLKESEAGFMLAEKIQEKNQEFIENKLGIHFDNWYSEDEKLRASGSNDAMLEKLSPSIEKKEGEGDALWLKTSEYGDDEDRVVVRSDGSKSYFISDISYHQDKFNRGYDKVIDIWGADHHGHVKRMYAAKDILGVKGELKVFITQMVSLKEGGEIKKMSKRAGTAILLEEIVDEFGIDVVRWFFAEKSLNTHMEFDEELAREQSEKNPVYYVQYTHARISSIIEKTKSLKSDKSSLSDALKDKATRSMALKLVHFADLIEEISENFQVHKLTTYVYDLSRLFSHFYHEIRIINDDTYNEGALDLVKITQKTIRETLGLLGISAPDKML